MNMVAQNSIKLETEAFRCELALATVETFFTDAHRLCWASWMILKASCSIRTVVQHWTSIGHVEIEMKTIRVSIFCTETHECVIVVETNKIRAFITWSVVVFHTMENWIRNC
jgi:hypothetical protein